MSSLPEQIMLESIVRDTIPIPSNIAVFDHCYSTAIEQDPVLGRRGSI